MWLGVESIGEKRKEDISQPTALVTENQKSTILRWW